MPPQTNITSEPALEALAVTRLHAPVAAFNAAGTTAASARSLSGWLKRYWHALLARRTDLANLSDRDLRDIGLSREEIDYSTPQRAIDRLRDSTAHLWSRSVM